MKTPFAVVCNVATTCLFVWPNGSWTIVTVSPARLFETAPVSVTCPPNLITGADAPSVTWSGAPRTTIVPRLAGRRLSW